MNLNEIAIELRRALRDGRFADASRICIANPEIVTDYVPDFAGVGNENEAWACFGVDVGQKALEVLLDAGFNIDAVNLFEEEPALTRAINDCDVEMVQMLLRRGASPNVGRPVVAAMCCDRPELQLPFVRLLVEHGLKLDTLYDLYGDASKAFTALDWADEGPIADYLRKHGARTAAELARDKSVVPPGSTSDEKSGAKRASSAASVAKDPAAGSPSAISSTAEVIAYFTTNVGLVDKRSVTELLPSDAPVAVHIIKPAGNRKHFTLFTTGLSARAMNVPSGEEDFALAELYIELPGDWKVGALKEANWSWPIRWLRRIAAYPHANKTWLGGALTIIANDDPPRPLAPNTPMTSLLLLADRSFKRTDGMTVQLYRLLPLYTEERELEMRKGAPELMRTLDRKSVPFIVDVNRPNAALE